MHHHVRQPETMLPSLVHRSERKKGLYLDFLILHLQFSLVQCRFKRQSCDLEWSVGHQYHCGFELGNVLSCAHTCTAVSDHLNIKDNSAQTNWATYSPAYACRFVSDLNTYSYTSTTSKILHRTILSCAYTQIGIESQQRKGQFILCRELHSFPVAVYKQIIALHHFKTTDNTFVI